MRQLFSQVSVTVLAIRRDRVLHALLGTALLVLLLVPALSLFSMRQITELAITLSLSSVSLLLLIFTVLLGSSSIWRDIEKRYLFSSMGMPLPRSTYLLGKFFGICLCLQICVMLMTCFSMAMIHLTTNQQPGMREVLWGNILLAFQLDGLKYMLLCAVAIFFSALATSFFVPIFGTLAIYLAGSASQEVLEFINTGYAEKLPDLLLLLCKGLYFLLPNFAVFDLKVYAVYGLPLDWPSLSLALVYFVVYTAIALAGALWAFERREML